MIYVLACIRCKQLRDKCSCGNRDGHMVLETRSKETIAEAIERSGVFLAYRRPPLGPVVVDPGLSEALERLHRAKEALQCELRAREALLCAVDELLATDAHCDPEFWRRNIEHALQHLRTTRGTIRDPKEPNGPEPQHDPVPTPEPDPEVLRVRAPAAAAAGDQQAAGRPGPRDGREAAVECGDDRRPPEAPRGEGLLREGAAAVEVEVPDEVQWAIDAFAEAAYDWAESGTEPDSELAAEERKRERELKAIIRRVICEKLSRETRVAEQRVASLELVVETQIEVIRETRVALGLPERGGGALTATARGVVEEREKYRKAASVLCGAHVGIPLAGCPMCAMERMAADAAGAEGRDRSWREMIKAGPEEKK